jgi:hypothetical protein
LTPRTVEKRACQAAAVQAAGRPEEVERRGAAHLLEQEEQDLHLQVGGQPGIFLHAEASFYIVLRIGHFISISINRSLWVTQR